MTFTTAMKAIRCTRATWSRARRTTSWSVEDLTAERDYQYPNLIRIVRGLWDTDGRQELGPTLRCIYNWVRRADKERRLYDRPRRCWNFSPILQNEGERYRVVQGTRRWVFEKVIHNFWDK